MANRKTVTTITIEGWSAHKRHNRCDLTAARIYETDQVFVGDDGVPHPLPNTWRLAQTVPFVFTRAEISMPAITLAPTVADDRPGPRLYALVMVDGQGRERWHGEDSEFVLPAEMGPVIHLYDLTVYNMELRGLEVPPA